MWTPALVAAIAALFIPGPAGGAEIGDGERLFWSGRYEACIDLAEQEIAAGLWEEDWHRLKARAEFALGKYPQASETVDRALELYPYSLPLRLLAGDAHRYAGRPAQAAKALRDIERYVTSAPRRYGAPADRIALGRFLLQRGADPRQVLEMIYDPLRKENRTYVDVYLATAELALDKFDVALAAETLEAAPDEAADDPHFHYLVARAYQSDEPKRAEKALKAALAINPRHVESLLLQVDALIDAEQYPQAEKLLADVLDVNIHQPTAWAYKAVLAHLNGDAAAEEAARNQALDSWTTNPEVDHLIGRKLSEKYRFAEGAEYQRRALEMQADYRPAKIQLSQDLLRLGEEVEGWRLANEVAEQDPYDVVAFNLTTLEKEVSSYHTLDSGDGLIVRMEAREAALYGARVLDLLRRAREVLCNKYGVELNEPIVVEIFPRQKDFAVRTFGLPGASGYLGVCFGRVITANSPASQGDRPANWESVLWHEFCHVVTLHKTHNKMPRWLSEGISVYEERQADPRWGLSMTPQYRQLIASGRMTPVSRLSSAFLAPPSPLHLQFAYYESSLVVEFLIERYGQPALDSILVDLGEGMEINEALLRHTAPLGRLDAEFAQFARRRADALAPGATWEEPDLPAGANAASIGEWLEQHPKSVPGLERWTRQLLREQDYRAAVAAADRLREAHGDALGAAEAYRLLAAAHRGLADSRAERAALNEVVSRDAYAADAMLRLMELGADQRDWELVETSARQMLAVNPLVAAPHRYLAQAAEELGRPDEAIAAYRALLEFEPADPAATHFRLARLLSAGGEREPAKRHVLMALEEAPRFLDAHRLLLELTEEPSEQAAPERETATEEARP